jgi:hypothetical protein
MSRAPLTAVTVLTILLLAAPAAGAKPRKRAPGQPATPVSVTILDGSTATLDLGNGAVRTAPLIGGLRGVIAGGYKLNKTNTITLRYAHVAIAPTELLSDGCPTAPATTSGLTSVGLAPGRKATAVVRRTGDVVADAPVILRTVLDVRPGACGAASVPTGYADTRLTIRAGGKIVRDTGLSHLTLDSAPAPVTVQGCLAPGAPATACSTAPVAYPVTLSTHLEVKVEIG